MLIWGLSTVDYADAFDGGYGLFNEGRWNKIGRPLTYAASSPSLCLLEKLVHVEDVELLPPLVLLAYDVPDDAPVERVDAGDLPPGWVRQEGLTQMMGDRWLAARSAVMLFVPSAIVPVSDGPDTNILINHLHPAAASVAVARREPFDVDVRLRSSSVRN